jgi:hypothetical protein
MNDAMRKAAEARSSANGTAAVSTIGSARSVAFAAKEIRAELVERDGRQFHRLDGYASVVEKPYEMWDLFGPYEEVIAAGAFDKTLANNPDVAFLVNHRGVTMARTTNGTLELSADEVGLRSVAYLNPGRSDVQLLMHAVDDGLITEMSFAFTIPDGGAWWSDDFATFRITEVDLNRGDTSAVNYGANPATTIAARSREIMRELQWLPPGAARAAIDQLRARPDLAPVTGPAQVPPVTAAVDAAGGSVELYEALLAIE